MEWYEVLILMLAVLMVLFVAGTPVAFAFLLINIGGLFLFMGGLPALRLMVTSAFATLASFVLAPVLLFILMGEIMFRSGLAVRTLDALDKWIGGIPGRLSLLAVSGGTLFSTLSGSSMATTAMLGTTLVPEMRRRGYSYLMSVGPISAAGGLAAIVPPTAMGVLLGSLAEISIAKLLIAGIGPGLFMAGLYAVYIVVRAKLRPESAPTYDVAHVSTREKVVSLLHLAPLSLIVFMVLGVIFIGVATPTEAAALGALSTAMVAAMYRSLTFKVIALSVMSTVRVSVVVLMIILASNAFSQVLAFTGASRGLVEMVAGFQAPPPVVILVLMMVIVLVLGMFVDQISIMMITVPIYFPLAAQLGFDPIWFGILMLLNMEVANTTPPFGLQLFVLKGVVPDAPMIEIYKSCFPFVLLDMLNLAVMIVFPALVLTLPRLMLS